MCVFFNSKFISAATRESYNNNNSHANDNILSILTMYSFTRDPHACELRAIGDEKLQRAFQTSAEPKIIIIIITIIIIIIIIIMTDISSLLSLSL